MGRYFSVSQGKVVDSPSQGAEATGNEGQMKQILIRAAFQDPKNASKYATLLSMIAPSASEVAAQAKKKEAEQVKDYMLGNIDRAIELLEKDKIQTGPLAGRWLSFKVKSGWGNPSAKEREAYSLIGEIGAKKMFELGGKVLPAQEIARLQPFIPDVNVANNLNLTNLKRLRTELTGSFNAYSGLQEPIQTIDPYYPESWEEEY